MIPCKFISSVLLALLIGVPSLAQDFSSDSTASTARIRQLMTQKRDLLQSRLDAINLLLEKGSADQKQVFEAKSDLLNTELSLAMLAAAEGDSAITENTIRELLKQKRDMLNEHCKAMEGKLESGLDDLEQFLSAKRNLLLARLDLATTEAERVNEFELHLVDLRKLDELVARTVKEDKNLISKEFVATAMRIDAEILLLREKERSNMLQNALGNANAEGMQNETTTQVEANTNDQADEEETGKEATYDLQVRVLWPTGRRIDDEDAGRLVIKATGPKTVTLSGPNRSVWIAKDVPRGAYKISVVGPLVGNLHKGELEEVEAAERGDDVKIEEVTLIKGR